MKKVIVLIFILFAAISVFSDGVILPDPDVLTGPRLNPIRMENHIVDIKIDDDIASISISEEFYNTSDSRVEVIYLFPVPKGALISKFSMTVGGKTYEGNILPADQARNIYEDYVRKQRDPALLEYVDNDLIKISIYPFEPYEKRTVELSYTQVLQNVNGTYKLQYPFKIDSLQNGSIKKVKFSGEIRSHQKIYQIYSPTNPFMSSLSEGSNSGSFEFFAEEYIPNNDVVLLFSVGERQVESYMNFHTDKDSNGFFMLDILPSVEFENTLPKNVILVLDKSGSMDGIKFIQARDAAKYVMLNLNEKDLFNIILFNEQIYTFMDKTDGSFPAEDYMKAITWLSLWSAGGWTNIYDSLDVALGKIAANSPLENTYILFLTDGLPTEGIQDEREIIGHAIDIVKRLGNVKIFTFGVGYDVNTLILDLLAGETGGLAFYVTENQGIESAITELYTKISNPLLTDVEIDFYSETVQFFDIVQTKNLSMYKNSPLKIFGRFFGEGEVTVKVKGWKGQDYFESEYDFDVSNGNNEYVSLLWAGRRINELINLIKLSGEKEELKNEIIKLSKEYQIPTPYTSFLILDESEGDAFQDQLVTSKSKSYDPSVPASQPSPMSISFGSASVKLSQTQNLVSQSMNLEEMKERMSFEKADSDKTILKGKIFMLDKDTGFWIDTEFVEEKQENISAFSDEYFELLKAIPELKEYLELGEKIKINFNGINYVIE